MLAPLQPLKPLAELAPPSFTGGVSSAVDTASKVASVIATGGASLLFGVSASRIIAIIVGLIVVTVALFSFRPVRETVVGVASNAAKVAAL